MELDIDTSLFLIDTLTLAGFTYISLLTSLTLLKSSLISDTHCRRLSQYSQWFYAINFHVSLRPPLLSFTAMSVISFPLTNRLALLISLSLTSQPQKLCQQILCDFVRYCALTKSQSLALIGKRMPIPYSIHHSLMLYIWMAHLQMMLDDVVI